jgi:peptidoglycan hydrolase-like protein with peptidoglycan-binding domain
MRVINKPGMLTAVVGACAICMASAIEPNTAVALAEGASPSSYASMLNGERAAHGLSPLRVSGDLVAVAQQWSAHMASSGTLAHNPGLTSQVSNWQSVGENVGEGPTVEDLDQAFWNSAEHRANILDPDYDEFGVGYTERDGIIWITVDFRDPLTTSSASSGSMSAPSSGSAPTVTTSLPTSNLLYRGSVGARVTRIQRILGIKHDGLYGPHTRHAVVGFQHRHHLRADGVVGPKTRTALRRFAHQPRPSLHPYPQMILWATLEHALSSHGT